ncbi:MAG: carboxypeptidase regulatory-like domain-containing protein [Planctomycetes bacterium]|nr:carboxypeptidase regulatory-like domain-containing protein [Planctomycetota bacterium]
MTIRRICAVLLPAIAVTIVLAGCGGSDKKIGAVSGKVTYRGQPVSEGSVSLVDTTAGEGAEATLNRDGTFKIETPEGGLPPGTYAVSISPPIYEDSSDPKTPPVMVQKKVKNIPEKYRSHFTSGLSATVKEGPNEVNLEMK